MWSPVVSACEAGLLYVHSYCIYTQAENNRGVDQTALMCKLICTFVVSIWHEMVFVKIWLLLDELHYDLFLPYMNIKGADQPAHQILRLASFWSWAGWFDSNLVATLRRQFFTCHGSLLCHAVP